MAGDEKTPQVIDMDPEVIVDYKTSAQRYEKLAELARQKAAKLEADRAEIISKQADAHTASVEANKALDAVNREVELQRGHVESLVRQREELGRQIDAAQSMGDRARVAELDAEFGMRRVEIEAAQQKLSETEVQQGITQADTDAKLKALTEIDRQAVALDDEIDKIDNARFNFETAAEYYTEAGRNRDLAEIAAGGDTTEIRKAVLGEADRVAEKYHEVATEQAEVFERYRAEEANLEALKGEQQISQREQARLEQEIEAAERAGRPDEAASLQKELDWRTQRTNALNDRVLLTDSAVDDLRAQNTVLHDEAQALKQDSESLRKLAREPAEKIEETFRERESSDAHEAMVFTPIKGDPTDTLGTELEEEAAATEAADEAATTEGTAGDTTSTNGDTDTTLETDPGASLDDLGGTDSTNGGTDGPAQGDGSVPAIDASDPGASLDDIDTEVTASASAPPADTPQADVVPRIVDDEMLEAPAAAAVTEAPAVVEAIQDAAAQEAVEEVEVERPTYDEPAVEPVAHDEPSVEPEPEPEPEPEVEFAE